MSDRIVGGHSLHAAEKPELCDGSRCGMWRTVDCCKRVEDMDVIECARCGKQKMVPCNFDEEYS